MTVAILALAVIVGAAACGEGRADEVVVLHTANAYGYFETCGCRSDSTGGLAKRAWVIDSLRQEIDAPILLVDAGDFSGGDNAYGAALGRVMAEAMEVMGYDAFTLGEWDLNQGTAYLREIIADNPMAWVHTNYEIAGLENLGHETLVIERGGRRIGLMGLYNPSILLAPGMRDSVVVEDIVESARAGVAHLRAEGVDAIVVLSHLSYKGDLALAEYVPGIDLIVSGHGGKMLAGAEAVAPGTRVVASGDLGSHLGRAVIELGAAGVQDVTGDLLAMEPGLPDDPRLDDLLARYEEERETLIRRELDSRRGLGGEPEEAGGELLESPRS